MRFMNGLTLVGTYDVLIGLYVMQLAHGLLKLAGLAGVIIGIICIWRGSE